MTIGLGTYTFFWQWHHSAEDPIGWRAMLDKTRDFGCNLFQFCDYAPMHEMDAEDAREVADYASSRGVVLELGTRGLDVAHMLHYLELARAADASFVRSMVKAEEAASAKELIGRFLPAYESAGVRIGLETYEQIRVRELVKLVAEIGSEYLGICLDPGNSVAALDSPVDTIRLSAPYVKNLHVKDFAFSRRDGWIGFTFAGARLGEGLLDYREMVNQVRPEERGINQIVEHWLVWQGDSKQTCLLEDEWTQHSLDYLRNWKGSMK